MTNYRSARELGLFLLRSLQMIYQKFCHRNVSACDSAPLSTWNTLQLIETQSAQNSYKCGDLKLTLYQLLGLSFAPNQIHLQLWLLHEQYCKSVNEKLTRKGGGTHNSTILTNHLFPFSIFFFQSVFIYA